MWRPLVPAALATIAIPFAFRWHLRRTRDVSTTLWRYVRLRWKLARAGWPSLMVIADFDRTLSTARCGTSCHGVLESCEQLSAEYRAATHKLVQHYLPIETSTSISREDKIPMMQDWYKQAHELLIKEALTHEILDTAAKRSAVELRPGCDELFDLCASRGAPMIVCSAGLGNVVRSLLRHRLPPATAAKVDPVNELPVASNWLFFGANGRLSGFSTPLLHMFNKNAAFIRTQLGAERWASLLERSGGGGKRRVVLLLGDGLGDATMAEGIGPEHDVIKIGFLNECDPSKLAAKLPLYEAAFDAVVLRDGPFDWILELLRPL